MKHRTTIGLGSLNIVTKHPGRVSGTGDDGTITRWNKACEMSDKINLPAAHKSMQRHHRSRAAFYIAVVAIVAVSGLFVHWAARLP
jgi:hypothetical protein